MRKISCAGSLRSNTECFIDPLGRVGLIQSVEVDPAHIVIEEIAALFGCPVNASIFDRLSVSSTALDRLEERGREAGPGREISHALEPTPGRDWHDACDDRHFDSREITSRAPVVKRMIVKEELRDDVVCAGVDLGLEMFELHQRVWCLGMTFGKASHPEREAPSIIDAKPLALKLDKPDKIRSVAEVTEGENACARRRIATKRKHAADAIDGIQLKNRADLVFRVTKAGEVRHGFKRCFSTESNDERVGVVAG